MVKKITIYHLLIPFLRKPHEWIHLAELSRELNQNHTTLRLSLNQLEDTGLLLKKHLGRMTLFGLNFHNPNITDYLVIAEKEKLISSCKKWPVLGELVSYIRENISNDILVFGSVEESFDKASDIDLFIVGNFNLKPLRNFARRLNTKLHIINTTLKDVSETLRKEIIKKHLVVMGSENLVRWMILQR